MRIVMWVALCAACASGCSGGGSGGGGTSHDGGGGSSGGSSGGGSSGSSGCSGVPGTSVGYCLSGGDGGLPQSCVAYTGSGWTLMAVQAGCSDGMAGDCPSMGIVGRCIAMCGKKNEVVDVYYAPTTMATAQSECQSESGVFLGP